MSYRTIEISWVPRSANQWRTFTACRLEAGRLWADLVERHFRLRRLRWRWPSKARWQRWAKRQYPHLSAQSCQQVIGEFCEAVESTKRLRRVDPGARYPWRKGRYRDVPYTSQDARLRDGMLLLPNGQAGTLRIRIPAGVLLPGRMREVRLCFGRVQIVCRLPDEALGPGPTIGVDLGVNTLIAATDGARAVVVSGRGVKATVQWRNKRLASLVQKQARHVKGSRRWRRLQRRKRLLLRKAQRRVRDSLHKATRQVAAAFPNAKAYVGEPFNDAAQHLQPRQAQTVSQAANRQLIAMLAYKLAGVITVDEAYTSQTCPLCGRRSKHRRSYRCACGVTAPRDVIGAVNILSIGRVGGIAQVPALPSQITYRRPDRRSASGHLASSPPRGKPPPLGVGSVTSDQSG
jgi:putative transposase